jgi:hypothetical protein
MERRRPQQREVGNKQQKAGSIKTPAEAQPKVEPEAPAVTPEKPVEAAEVAPKVDPNEFPTVDQAIKQAAWSETSHNLEAAIDDLGSRAIAKKLADNPVAQRKLAELVRF